MARKPAKALRIFIAESSSSTLERAEVVSVKWAANREGADETRAAFESSNFTLHQEAFDAGEVSFPPLRKAQEAVCYFVNIFDARTKRQYIAVSEYMQENYGLKQWYDLTAEPAQSSETNDSASEPWGAIRVLAIGEAAKELREAGVSGLLIKE